jgi:UDP-GlcNAc:undecaprenyl-phosphate GlcNAc-1-phosphate transferase
VGLLMFLFVQWWWAVLFIGVGFIVTSAFTLAPLGRRKQSEVEAQLTEVSDADTAEAADVAKHDPLDAGAVLDVRTEGADR